MQSADRILDAPDIIDDYYLNVVDWSASNQLAVALASTAFIWNADNGAITPLLEAAGISICIYINFGLCTNREGGIMKNGD